MIKLAQKYDCTVLKSSGEITVTPFNKHRIAIIINLDNMSYHWGCPLLLNDYKEGNTGDMTIEHIKVRIKEYELDGQTVDSITLVNGLTEYTYHNGHDLIVRTQTPDNPWIKTYQYDCIGQLEQMVEELDEYHKRKLKYEMFRRDFPDMYIL